MVDLDDPVAQINAHLPPPIRVMSVKRVTRGFDSHKACNARMYEYLVPTYAFAPYHKTIAGYRLPGQQCTSNMPHIVWGTLCHIM